MNSSILTNTAMKDNSRYLRECPVKIFFNLKIELTRIYSDF